MGIARAARPGRKRFSNDQGGKTVWVLSRHIGEEIVIDEHIRVVVAAVQPNRVRLGICAPAMVCVDRQDVHERRSVVHAIRPRPVQVRHFDNRPK